MAPKLTPLSWDNSVVVFNTNSSPSPARSVSGDSADVGAGVSVVGGPAVYMVDSHSIQLSARPSGEVVWAGNDRHVLVGGGADGHLHFRADSRCVGGCLQTGCGGRWFGVLCAQGMNCVCVCSCFYPGGGGDKGR